MKTFRVIDYQKGLFLGTFRGHNAVDVARMLGRSLQGLLVTEVRDASRQIAYTGISARVI
jgi:hypothetical protein